MAGAKIYKKFYTVSYTGATSASTYTLFNPFVISDAVVRVSGSTDIIQTITPTNLSTGIFFVELNPSLYNFSYTYEVDWAFQYTSSSSAQHLYSYFNFNPNNISLTLEMAGSSSRFKNMAFEIKKNDTLPALQVKINKEDCLRSIQPFNLSGVTAATFTMIDSCGNTKIFSQSAQIVCPEDGLLQYNWAVGDTDESGRYKGEFELNFVGGGKMSFPTIGTIEINILRDLNDN